MPSTKSIAIRIALFLVASAAIGATAMWLSHDDIERVDVRRLNPATAISRVVGSGTHQVHIFESTDCIFCRQLQPELDKLRDVTLHVYVLPGHTKASNAHAAAVYCDALPYQAWHDLMASKAMLEGPSCGDGIAAENLSLARELGLTRTPTLIRGDGKVISGLKSAAEIQKWIEEG